MKAILNSIHRYENKCECKLGKFVCNHNFLIFFLSFTVMPFFIILALIVGTIVIGYPLSLLLELL